MKRKTCVFLLFVAAFGVLVPNASAYYDPGQGRFLTRDPGPHSDSPSRLMNRDPIGQYADGMNLYQYSVSSPSIHVDPFGTVAIVGNKFGDWDFTQTTTDAPAPGGRWSTEAKIVFKTKNKCACDEIAFVQTFRDTDTTTGRFRNNGRPNFQNRITKNGWMVDRVDDRKYGWYGYDNDNTPSAIVSPGNTSGASPVDATLDDTPSFTPVNFRENFETCAICKKGADSNKVYGCLTWGFTVDAAGKLTALKPGHNDAASTDFGDAVAAWNKQAKGPLPQRNHPDQVELGPFKIP